MKTIDEIKDGMLTALGEKCLGSSMPANEIRKAFTADGLLDAIVKNMDFLVRNGVVNGKILQTSFPNDKLWPRCIYVGNSDLQKEVTSGVGYFFGKSKGVVSGQEALGNFYEQSYGLINEGRGHFFGNSKAEVKNGFARLTDSATGVVTGRAVALAQGRSEIEANERSEVFLQGNAYGKAYGESSMTLTENARGEAYDWTKVEASEIAHCKMCGESYGVFQGESHFRALNHSRIEAYDNSCGVALDESSVVFNSKGNLHDRRGMEQETQQEEKRQSGVKR